MVGGFRDSVTRSVGAAYDRYIAAICERPRRALLVLGLVCLPALALSVAFFAHIEAGLQELLPPSAPSVRALTKLHELVGGKAHLTVIARSPDRDANERFISELTKRLAAQHLPEIESIQGDVKAERAWLTKRGPLLMNHADFDKLVARMDTAIRAERRRQLSLGLDEEDQPAFDWAGIQKEVDTAIGEKDRFPRGYLESADGQLVVALIWLEGSEVDLDPSAKLMQDVQQQVDTLRPQFPNIEVAYNGEVPNLVEEHDAILADLSISTVFVMALVGLCIALYFRSARAVTASILSLVPGLLFTFALGRETVGGLNSNTAFLGTIIAGNGINYPLLLLAYYRAQPPALERGPALAAAARQALPGTLGAALTASAAYGGLAVSNFRGFSQFGWLGGTGMLLVWLFTYATTPIWVALMNPPRRQTRSTAVQDAIEGFFSRRSLTATVAGSFCAITVAWCGVGVFRAVQSGVYEMDLQVLRNRESLAHGSASWDAKMNEVFGVWLNPVVALAERPDDREAAAAAVRSVFADHDPAGIERVDTVEKFVPPIAEQTTRLAELARLGHSVRKIPPDKIPGRLRDNVATWFPKEPSPPIQLAEVPESLLSPFRELSGRVDRVVLVYPSIKVNYNDGHNLLRFAHIIRDASFPRGVIVGGGFLFMAEILQLVHDEALSVVAVVALLVSVLLVLLFAGHPGRAAVSLVAMVGAAFCSQAAMLALGVKVNMLNFAALPITIGVGADYVVNLFGAMRSLSANARIACARMGSAILLCSITTVIGYLSLVLAQSGALRSFGWAAVLGELMAILTVLLVLPAVLGARLSEAPVSAPPALGERT